MLILPNCTGVLLVFWRLNEVGCNTRRLKELSSSSLDGSLALLVVLVKPKSLDEGTFGNEGAVAVVMFAHGLFGEPKLLKPPNPNPVVLPEKLVLLLPKALDINAEDEGKFELCVIPKLKFVEASGLAAGNTFAKDMSSRN